MLTIKRSVAIIAILFGPLSTANNLTSRLRNFFSAQLMGVSDEVRVSIRTVPNLSPSCEQPSLSMNDNSRLWGSVNVLARCGSNKRYLQTNVQATGNYMVIVMPIVWEGKLEVGNVELKRGRLDTLPSRTILDINQLADTISPCDPSPDQPIQLIQFRQAWRVKAGQRVSVIAGDDGFGANTEGQTLSNAAVTQNVRVCMVPGQVVNDVVDANGNILINLQAVKDYPFLAGRQATYDKNALNRK